MAMAKLFLQLGRYGKHTEQGYRGQYEKPFDFLSFNRELILEYYRTRFQIEFIYRDAKQFTGLNDCQARSEIKLHFHFNASLTAINLAKITHWISIPKQERKAFSK